MRLFLHLEKEMARTDMFQPNAIRIAFLIIWLKSSSTSAKDWLGFGWIWFIVLMFDIWIWSKFMKFLSLFSTWLRSFALEASFYSAPRWIHSDRESCKNCLTSMRIWRGRVQIRGKYSMKRRFHLLFFSHSKLAQCFSDECHGQSPADHWHIFRLHF